MKIPRLNQRLILEAPTRVPDGGGGVGIVWVARGTVWGELRPRSGRETVSGGRESARVGYRVTLRSAPPGSPRRPTPDCRFRLGRRIFDILAVRPLDERDDYLACDVVEGAFA